ncbi:MAG: AAA family ATPase [Magnetococcales bacterium]|nr:AAA family ATPase [Magnetococcales bacterium]
MELTVQNFLGISEARIAISDGITLMAGENGAGKSSLLRAAAACATGSVIPVILPSGKEAILRGESRIMVHAKGKKGVAKMSHGEQEITLTWPANTTKGQSPVNTTLLSAGLVEWMGIPSNARREYLSTAMAKGGLTVEPVLDDLANAMSAAGVVDEKYIQYVCGLIEKDGWDPALQVISSKWSEVTGMWRAVSGEAYGPDKVKEWRPKGWDTDLDGCIDIGVLAKAVDGANRALEDGISRRAVDGAVMATLRAEAAIPMIDPAVDEAARAEVQKKIDLLRNEAQSEHPEIKTLQDRLRNIQGKIEEIRIRARDLEISRPVAPSIHHKPDVGYRNATCPSCKTRLLVTNKAGVVIMYAETKTTTEMMQQAETSISQEKAEATRCKEANKTIDMEIAGLADDRNSMEKEQQTLTARIQEVQQQRIKTHHDQMQSMASELASVNARIASISQKNKAIQDAIAKLQQITSKDGATVTDDTIAQLRSEVERHTRRLHAAEAMDAAKIAADRAERLAIVKTILAKDGLRASKLRAAMNRISELISGVCSVASWPAIPLDDELNLSMDGRPYTLLSKSEQFRCQVTVQVAMARLDGSDLLIIDGADILDSSGRFGLIQMLRAMGIRAMVAMTAKKDYAETISRMFDAAFWVNGGQVEEA